MSIFEQASRLKLRFATVSGTLDVEDLWDLPLQSSTGRAANLDDLARSLHESLESSASVSFVTPESKVDPQIQLAFDIVKRVIEVKLAERDEAKRQRERAQKRQRLMQILAQKQDQELESKSAEEIQTLLAELD